MTQFQEEFALYRNRYFWAAITAVLLTALLTVSIANAGHVVLQIIYAYADPQMVDTDGDGRPGPFSADFKVFDDGTAAGTIGLRKFSNITLKRGIPSCQDGEPTAVLFGTESQYRNGQWVEVGEAQLDVQQNRDGNGGAMIWSIETDDFQYAFESTGQFAFETSPCQG